jgi:hypothetical protein
VDNEMLNWIMMLALVGVAVAVAVVRESPTALRNLSNWALSRAAGLDAFARVYSAKRNRKRPAAQPQTLANGLRPIQEVE